MLSPLINQAFYYTRRSFDDALRDYGITASQIGVLRRINDHPGITGAELSRRMFTTPQAAQLMLATLERKGLVERKPDESSGRQICSSLTDDGRSLLQTCLAESYRVERRMASTLNDGERRTLYALLERYVNQLPALLEDLDD